MTVYYLSSVDGDNGSDGLSWANAYATFKYAVETASAAASGPHTLYVDSAHSESLSADNTITAAGDIRIICVNRSGGDAPTTGAVVGAQATNYSISLQGAYEVYVYGVTFQNGTNTTVNKVLNVNITDGGQYELTSCTFVLAGGSGAYLLTHGSPQTGNYYTRFISCTFTFGNAGHKVFTQNGLQVFEGCTATGTAPTALFQPNAAGQVYCEGCDWSLTTNTLISNAVSNGYHEYRMANCKVAASTLLAAATGVLNKGQTTLYLFNCESGDEHYHLYHGDAFGETTAVVTYYADDGAKYDGTNFWSWKIVTRASNCSFYTPYVSPWIDVYHSATSAITPYLEGLRVDSTTVIQDDEVWGEFSFQATSGYTTATLKNDRMALLGTAADQTSSLTYANWTGSPTDTDSGDSVFKLAAPSATTPAEIGHIRARVCVGEPGLTVYIDPQIRGLS